MKRTTAVSVKETSSVKPSVVIVYFCFRTQI